MSMLRFVDRPQTYPEVEAAQQRITKFDEIYAPFDPTQAGDQAQRCSQCGIPFCQIHCPLQNNIPDWLRLTAQGRLEEAYQLSAATNNFPEICGRICPQDKLCEGNCVIEHGFGAVTIGSIEKFLTETAFEQGWVKPNPVAVSRGQSVGIIGAGPAGLAAADMLVCKGYGVTIYDRYDRVGGLMIYGIPHFKLEKHVVARREALLRQSGVKFELGCSIDAAKFAQLRNQHDAVLIATGVYKARALEVKTADLAGVVPALEYLTVSNRVCLGDRVAAFESGEMNAHGKRVVVVGGGDTAMDCVRTAVRQGAISVVCLYRRDQANMPGSAREVKHAQEEGVEFRWLSAPKTIEGKCKIEQVVVQKMRLAQHDARGRQTVEAAPGEEEILPADMLITALGFEAEDMRGMFGVPELQVSPRGTIHAALGTGATNMPCVFAAGDIVRGASLVVWAIRDGRDAAEGIDLFLQAKIQAKAHSHAA